MKLLPTSRTAGWVKRALPIWSGLAALLTLTFSASADHGLPHPVLLGRGTFFSEDVSVQYRVKDGLGGTQVLQVSDASDMVVLQITIEAGGIAPWHTHEGTGLLINTGPGTVTNLVGDDCVPQVHPPNAAFVDPGIGDLHAVRNDSDQEVVLLAVFVGVQGGPVIPTGGGPEGCDFLP